MHLETLICFLFLLLKWGRTWEEPHASLVLLVFCRRRKAQSVGSHLFSLRGASTACRTTEGKNKRTLSVTPGPPVGREMTCWSQGMCMCVCVCVCVCVTAALQVRFMSYNERGAAASPKKQKTASQRNKESSGKNERKSGPWRPHTHTHTPTHATGQMSLQHMFCSNHLQIRRGQRGVSAEGVSEGRTECTCRLLCMKPKPACGASISFMVAGAVHGPEEKKKMWLHRRIMVHSGRQGEESGNKSHSGNISIFWFSAKAIIFVRGQSQLGHRGHSCWLRVSHYHGTKGRHVEHHPT